MFIFSGTVGGQAINWQAGNDKRYQHTTYRTGSTGLFVFEGTLGDKQCPECGPALKVLVHDTQLRSSSNPLLPEHLVTAGLRQFTDMSFVVNRGIVLSLQPLLMNLTPNPTFLWYFGDGTFSADSSPTKVYQQPGQYTVCLTAMDTQMRQDSLCNVFTITNEPRACDALFSFQHLGGNKVEFRAAILDPGTKYRWNFGDGTGSGMPVTQKQFNSSSIHRVCLQVLKDECVAQFCMRVPIPDTFGSVANYTYQIAIDTTPNLAGLAEIQWVDGQGRVYSSFRAKPQPFGSSLEFRNVEAYERNTVGQATRNFDFDTEVWLYRINDPTDSLKLDGAGTFAVAYPD